MKTLTRKQAIEQGYTLNMGHRPYGYKDGDVRKDSIVDVMPEREEALVETLRQLVRGLELTSWSSWQTTHKFSDQWEDAEKLLEKYDGQDAV